MNLKSFLLLALFLAFCVIPKPELQARRRIDEEGMHQLALFGNKLAKKHGLIYLNKGVGSVVDSKNVAWDLSLMGYQQITLEQARSFVVPIIEDFWHQVTTNPIFVAYLKNAHSIMDWYDPRLTPKRIGIKIALWDANIDRYPAPYISQIKICDGLVHYYQADSKDQSLQEPPFIESFEEAFARSNRGCEKIGTFEKARKPCDWPIVNRYIFN
jgi:hypothetical protein